MVLFIFCRKQLKPGKESTVNSTTYVLSVQEAKVSFRIMVLKPKEQVSDLTSLGKDGKVWLTLFWLQIWSTVLTSLTSVEISSLISVKAKLDQTLCLHLLEPCSPWLSLENRGGDLRAVSLLWGLPWESLSGCPISLVSALSCHWACPVASRDEHLLPGEPFALAEWWHYSLPVSEQWIIR